MTLVLINPEIQLFEKPSSRDEYAVLSREVAYRGQLLAVGNREFLDLIGKRGMPFYGCTFENSELNPRLALYRTTYLYVLDFDKQSFDFEEAIKRTEKAAEVFKPVCMYHTFSSTEKQNRFRIVFSLSDYAAGDYEYHREVMKHINEEYYDGEADPRSISPIKFWQGSTKGGVYYNGYEMVS